MSDAPPTTGFYLFHGTRRRGNTGYIESIHVPVQVIAVLHFHKPSELAVKMIGRQLAYRMEAFEGTWQRIATEVGG